MQHERCCWVATQVWPMQLRIWTKITNAISYTAKQRAFWFLLHRSVYPWRFMNLRQRVQVFTVNAEDRIFIFRFKLNHVISSKPFIGSTPIFSCQRILAPQTVQKTISASASFVTSSRVFSVASFRKKARYDKQFQQNAAANRWCKNEIKFSLLQTVRKLRKNLKNMCIFTGIYAVKRAQRRPIQSN